MSHVKFVSQRDICGNGKPNIFTERIRMLKNFIIQSGELIINILVVIGLLIALVSGIGAMQFSFMMGLVTLLAGVAGVILLAFVLYLLIDMRDNLKQLNADKHQA